MIRGALLRRFWQSAPPRSPVGEGKPGSDPSLNGARLQNRHSGAGRDDALQSQPRSREQILELPLGPLDPTRDPKHDDVQVFVEIRIVALFRNSLCKQHLS